MPATTTWNGIQFDDVVKVPAIRAGKPEVFRCSLGDHLRQPGQCHHCPHGDIPGGGHPPRPCRDPVGPAFIEGLACMDSDDLTDNMLWGLPASVLHPFPQVTHRRRPWLPQGQRQEWKGKYRWCFRQGRGRGIQRQRHSPRIRCERMRRGIFGKISVSQALWHQKASFRSDTQSSNSMPGMPQGNRP